MTRLIEDGRVSRGGRERVGAICSPTTARGLVGALLAAGLCAGCGARSSIDAGDALAGAGGSETPSSTTPGPGEPRFDCRLSEQRRPMLAARIGADVLFVYPDRSSAVVATFDVPEGMYIPHAAITARGDRVAAYAVVNALGGAPGPAPFAQVVLLDVDGEVLSKGTHEFAYEGWGADSQLVGNDRGRFVLSLVEVQAQLGLVLDDGGVEPFPERMAARSDPDAQGRLVVWDADSSSTATLHFFDTEAGTFAPSKYLSLDPIEDIASSPTVLGSGILYLQRNPPRVTFEDASGSSERPIDVELDPTGHAIPGYSASGGYRLFSLGGLGSQDVRFLATHFESGEAWEFKITPPDGLFVPESYAWGPPPIDARGRSLVVAGGGEALFLFATRDGSSFEQVGLPIAATALQISVKEAGGAVIFDGGGGGEEVPGLLPPWATQLIGPQGGEGVELVRWEVGAPDNPFYAEDTISADGACVAYFRNGSLHVVETADYTSSDLGIGTTDQSAETAWIPVME